MTTPPAKTLLVPLVVAVALVSSAANIRPAAPAACRMSPGPSLMLLRVERETTLAFTPAPGQAMSSSSVPAGPRDSLLATPGTPMPAAQVRLLRLDSATRATLAGAGIAADEPSAFLRAAPYRADCRTIRWRGDSAWVEQGDTGYARGYLEPREHWVDGVPVFVIRHTWSYPYPRQRGLLFRAPPDEGVAPPAAVFGLDSALSLEGSEQSRMSDYDRLRRVRAMTWIRGNLSVADLEPVRSEAQRAVLAADWQEAARMPSRLRGSYMVTMETGEARQSWYFRTHDRPSYSWRDDEGPSAVQLLASPHVTGYSLVSYPALARDELPTLHHRGSGRRPLTWLASADRPTAPGNHERRVLDGYLEFTLSAAPESLWPALEQFIPPPDTTFSTLSAKPPASERQPRLPLTIRLDGSGGVTADTTLIAGGAPLRVRLVRLDTMSISRAW